MRITIHFENGGSESFERNSFIKSITYEIGVPVPSFPLQKGVKITLSSEEQKPFKMYETNIPSKDIIYSDPIPPSIPLEKIIKKPLFHNDQWLTDKNVKIRITGYKNEIYYAEIEYDPTGICEVGLGVQFNEKGENPTLGTLMKARCGAESW